jgi:hypothetical protein
VRPPRDRRDAAEGELSSYDAVICLVALSNDPLGEMVAAGRNGRRPRVTSTGCKMPTAGNGVRAGSVPLDALDAEQTADLLAAAGAHSACWPGSPKPRPPAPRSPRTGRLGGVSGPAVAGPV